MTTQLPTLEGELINTHVPLEITSMEHYGKENHQSDSQTFKSLSADPLKILGKFVGEWDGQLEEASKTATKFVYAKEFGDSTFHVNNLSQYPIFTHMQELLGFKKNKSWAQIQLLRPGNALCRHIDTKSIFEIPTENSKSDWCYPDDAVRVIIMLAEWEYGQIFGFNNTVFSKWESGTIITCDFLNTWHFECNSSWHTLPILVISGITDNILKDLIAQNKTTVINI